MINNRTKNLSSQILIVEDDQNTRSMYEAHFDNPNFTYDVIIYSSATDALIDLPLILPRIILTDLKMSSMTGFKFINSVRNHKDFSSLPIIAMTGMTNEEIAKHGGLEGDVMILNKPIDMNWLTGLLKGIFLMLDN